MHDNIMQNPLLIFEKPVRRGALLDLTFINKGGLIGELKVEGTIDFSDNGMAEFRILRGESQTKSKITTQDFRRADYFLFRDLSERIPWDKALSQWGTQESWLIFNNPLFQAQKQTTQQVQMSKMLLAKFKHKKKA